MSDTLSEHISAPGTPPVVDDLSVAHGALAGLSDLLDAIAACEDPRLLPTPRLSLPYELAPLSSIKYSHIMLTKLLERASLQPDVTIPAKLIELVEGLRLACNGRGPLNEDLIRRAMPQLQAAQVQLNGLRLALASGQFQNGSDIVVNASLSETAAPARAALPLPPGDAKPYSPPAPRSKVKPSSTTPRKSRRGPRRISKVQIALALLICRAKKASESIRVEDIATEAGCTPQNLYKSPEFQKGWKSAHARRIRHGWKVEGVADCQNDSTLDVG